MTTRSKLIEKLRAGGQITLEDLESLGRKKDPTGRPAKVCSPRHALAKAKKGVALNRWELEDLAKSPVEAVEYARLKNERFPECEEHLVKSTNDSIVGKYFLEVVGKRNETFERWMIGGNPEYIKDYCVFVLKSRWEEGEREILKITHPWKKNELNLDDALAYQKEIVGGPWEALERVLLNGKVKVEDRPDAIRAYFRNCGQGRLEGTEQRLLKCGSSLAVFLYARHCVGGRLPDELHNRMILGGKKSAKKYVAWLASKKKSVLNYLASLPEREREELFPETVGRTG